MNQNICNNCGGEYEYRGGRFICRSCGAYKPEEISNEEITLLYTAYQNLRLAEFDAAEKEFDDIIEKYPQNPNGYWGRLMARYGIKYERDFDGRMIPTCYATSIESVIAASDYKKAMQYADKDTREYYRRQAEYIERVRVEWVQKASREKPYDIFISYKDSDLANGIDRTQDSVEMQELYIHLTNKGYRVFFSRESLRDKVGEKYEPYIFSALSTAKVMLVYGSKPEYITSTWLKNEWTRYEKRIAAGEKKPDSLLVACDGFSPAELPRELSSRQCFNASAKSFYSDLDEALERLLREPKKKAAVIAEPIFRDVEPEAAKPEEKKKKSFVPFIFIGLFVLICGFAVYAMMGGSLGYSDPVYEASTTDPTHVWVPGVNGGDPECEHKIVTMPGEEATCRDHGYTEGEYCELCGMTFKSREEIPASPEYHKFPEGSDPTQVRTCTVCGQSVTPWEGTEGLAYEEDDNGYVVVGLGTATATEIYIPKYYNDRLVYAIGANAFKDQKQLTAVYLHDAVSSIGSRAFYGCTGLTSFTFPSELSEVKAQAFYRCDNLKTLYVKSHSDFGDNTFLKQSSVEKIVFGHERASLNLQGVTSVKELVFTSAVKSIQTLGGSSSVTKITIENGADEILHGAFANITSLEEISIPESVRVIGFEAFNGCTALAKVELPETLTEISGYAFQGCTALKEITLPDGLTDIGESAFVNCGLVSITVPESVMTVGSWAFSNCKSLREVILTDGMPEIPTGMFCGCTALTSVSIPESVYSIGESAFKECTSLRTITLPFDLAEIQTSAFEGCTGLIEVINHSTLELRAGDTEHGYVAYYALVIHDGEESQLVTLGDYTVYDQGEKYLLLSYHGTETAPVLPDMIGGKYYTIAQGAFAGRSDITSITVPTTVTEIGEGAFAGCSGLVSMDLPFVGGSADGTEKFGYIFGTQKYGDNDIYVGGYYMHEGLTSVTVRGGLIGEYAFEQCSDLTEIILGDGVTSIGAYAFHECNALVSLTTPIACPITEGYDFFYNFFNDNADSVPAGLKVTFTGDTLPERAFAECSKIEEIVLTGNLTGIADAAFRNCSALKEIVIPASVTLIDKYAFSGCMELEAIIIPEGVTSIGEYVFNGCKKLKEITLPSTLTAIGAYAFEYCESLTIINFAGTQAEWNAISFGSEWDDNTGAYTVVCSDGTPSEPDTPSYSVGLEYSDDGNGAYIVTGIGTCSDSNIVIPSTYNGRPVVAIGDWAFYSCSGLLSVSIPEGVMEIGEKAFRNCSGLTFIDIPNGVTAIGAFAFGDCMKLATINIPASVTTIDTKAFYTCTALSVINYAGTDAQWNEISFGSDWNINTGTYTLICAGGAGEPEAPGIPSDVRVDQTVTFGSYEQDNDSANGKEAIEWIVLDVQDGRALLLSKYALDARAYSSYVQNLNFACSDVYKWLNAEFISAAFSDDERAKIVTTTISADPNPYYGTDQGGATQDKIFLLSIEEAETYLQPIFRVCESTEYAQSPSGNCAWWLRTMGYTSKDAAYVSAAGVIFPEGNPTEAMFGVRPAMWVELNP